MNVNQKDIEWLSASTEEFKKQIYSATQSGDVTAGGGKSGKKRVNPLVWPGFLLLFIAAILLPFFILIRGGLFFWYHWEINAWLALGLSAVCTMLLLSGYVLIFLRWITGKWKLSRWIPRIVGVLTLSYCLYGLFYLSSVNTKTEEVRSHYITLHPMLRITAATLTLADKNMLITDTARELSDYEKMGLTVNQNSLHFKQEDGFVHAIDLRTVKRNSLHNRLVQAAFRVSGFETLRHTGTADHLHVSLSRR